MSHLSRPRAQFSGSLAGFRYSDQITTEQIEALCVNVRDAARMVSLIHQVGQIKEAMPHFDWSQYKPFEATLKLSGLPRVEDTEKVDILNKIAVVKLNGGASTSLGLDTPKALLEIKTAEKLANGTSSPPITFLSATIDYLTKLNHTFRDCSIPLVLMNRADNGATNAAVERLVEANCDHLKVIQFEQRQFPRLHPATLRPLPEHSGDKVSSKWAPCGHGDVYENLYSSGTAKQLVDLGKEFVFISNIDNLGANIESAIPKYMIEHNIPYLIETTRRNALDSNGGLVTRRNGGYSLLEMSQVPGKHLDQFNMEYSAWNTNNMWVHLPTLINKCEEGHLVLPPMVTVRFQNDQPSIHLETAAGSAIASFKGAAVLDVPRSRYRVIKTTADLMMVRSASLFRVENGSLIVNPRRGLLNLPLVKWGEDFRTMAKFEARVPYPPDMTELAHLTVEGDVTFGKGVKLIGTVIIVAAPGKPIMIPAGATLRNNVITGTLTMTPY